MSTLFSLYWLYAKPRKRDSTFRLFQIIMWTTAVAELWAIVANRSHYTVDVVVAIYTSIGVYYTFEYFFQNHIIFKNRLLDLTNPHEYHLSITN